MGCKQRTAQNFLHPFPLCSTPVVQSYWARREGCGNFRDHFPEIAKPRVWKPETPGFHKLPPPVPAPKKPLQDP